MFMRSNRSRLMSACASVVIAGGFASFSSAFAAAPLSYTTPNVTTTAGAETSTLNGVTYTNQGLVGAGRLSASTVDFLGDTLGSFSSMSMVRSSWRKSGSGYAATLYTLPDRGRNDPANNVFYNYVGRVNEFAITVNPYTGTTNLAASTSSQNQVTFAQSGGIKLTDYNGNPFTGADPGAGTRIVNGIVLPSPVAGATGAGKISLDAEGLVLLSDGSFYISDEYAANIYYFDATGRLKGIITPPKSLEPYISGSLNFNSINPPTTGRRNNQGMEGLSVSPDGTRLFAVLQSATLQDSSSSADQTRTNTRVLVYDISGTATPDNPIGHYVLQLPTYTAKGNGSAANKTAAQSEALSINNSQFLLLSRDGNGLGTGSTNPEVYKSILLVDISKATNIAGTSYETGTTPIDTIVSNQAQLNPDITPVAFTQVVNMLNTTQLAKFGLNANTTPVNQPLTISEKWEAMALMPALDEAKPQDFLLFVGNDNDFITTNGTMDGTAYSDAFNNDSMMLVYRVTLPTAVDPLYYQAMVTDGAQLAALVGETSINAASSAQSPLENRVNILRAATRAQGMPDGLNVWMNGSFGNDNRSTDKLDNTDPEALSGAVGIDASVMKGLTVGGAIIGGGVNSSSDGYRADQSFSALGLYAEYANSGFFASGAYSYVPSISISNIERPAVYGLNPTASTNGHANTLMGQLGYLATLGPVAAGPVFSASYLKANVGSFTETGASGGNIAYPSADYDRTTLGFGVEGHLPLEILTLTSRASYNYVTGDDSQTEQLSLASVVGGYGTANVSVPTLNSDNVRLGVGVQGGIGTSATIGWYANYDAFIGVQDASGVANQVSAGLNFKF